MSTALADTTTREAAIAKIHHSTPDVDAVVVVLLKRTSNTKQSARIFVVPAHGEIRETTASLSRGSTALLTNIRTELHAAAESTPPPDPPAAADATPPATHDPPARAASPLVASSTDRDAADAPAPTVSHEAVAVVAGMEAGGRRFIWRDALRGTLRDYSLAAAPLAFAQASLYPLATTRIPVLADIGVSAGAGRAFALSSSDSGGGSASTTWTRWAVGPRFRIRTGGEAPRLVVTIGADYARETFDLASAVSPSTLPSVDYRTVNPNVLARIVFGNFAVFAEAGYRYVLDTGNMGERFPHASVAGVDGELGCALTIARGLELRASAHYSRFFYAMNSQHSDLEVAGGAVDQLFGLGGGLAYAR